MFEGLVDHQGKLWPTAEGDFVDAADGGSGDRLAEDDPVAEAIWSRGYIYLRSAGPTLIVALRPRLVARPALIGAFYEICKRSPAAILLSYAPGSKAERFDDVEAALHRLDQIVSEAQETTPRGLSSHRVTLDVAERIDGGVMTELLAAWYDAERRWSPEFYNRLEAAALLDNAVVVRNPAASDTLVIEHWGKKRDLFGAKWIREARGRQIEEQPYSGLARWVGQLYREAIAESEPRLDIVSVAILTPRGALRRKHYSRLLLPWRGEGGEAFALTVNVFDLPRAADQPPSTDH